MRWSRRSQDESSHGVFVLWAANECCSRRGVAKQRCCRGRQRCNAAVARAARAARRGEGRPARRGQPGGAGCTKPRKLHTGIFGALNLSLGWNRELGLGFFAGDALLVKARNQDGSWTALDSRPSCSSWSLWTAPCHTRKRNTPVGHVCRRGRATKINKY